jgi:asparagine synthase (glutamine-hydrolysing)
MPALPSSWRVNNPRQKVEKLGEVLHHTSIESLYEHLVSHWTNPEDVVIGGTEPPTAVTDLYPPVDLPSDVETMMFTDLISYLPDDILTKVDRASMAVSLEARVPILDHRVVEFAWTIPLEMKIRNGDSKWLLRQVLYRHVPREIMERPKMGFGVPIDDWLRGPLRDWAEALLDRQRLRDEGFLAPDPIREVWNSHISGEVANHYLIWDVLMFQAWLENEGQELTGQPDSDSVQAALGNRH